jgi:hypothetical protein
MRSGERDTAPAAEPSNSSSVLTPGQCVVLSWKWFAFVVRGALSHACRHADYVTLVTIRASREYVGSTIDIGAHALSEIAEVINPTLRAADIFGLLENGELGILLPDADEEAAAGIIQRFAEKLGHVRFSSPMTFAIGAASCPTHGVHGDDLVAHATMHPVLAVCAGSAPLDDLCLPCL